MTELRDMIRLYSAKMEPIHIAATLTRLQQLLHATGRSRGTAALTEEQRQQGLASGIEAMQLLVPVIEGACGITTGGAAAAGPKEVGAAAVRSHQRPLRPDSAAACLWALAKLPPAVRAQLPGAALDAVLARAVRIQVGPCAQAMGEIMQMVQERSCGGRAEIIQELWEGRRQAYDPLQMKPVR